MAAPAGASLRKGLATVLAREQALPVVEGLAGLFPEGLRRGSSNVVAKGAAGGAALLLCLLSGPSAAGSWCAVVGGADLGLVAAAQLGVDLGRLALVPDPGASWAVVTAALLEGFDVVALWLPGGRASVSDARKLEARARERGSVLLVLGEGWPGAADVRLSVASASWQGLGEGHGFLAGCELEVVSGGRGAASRPRRACLQLKGVVPEGLAEPPAPFLQPVAAQLRPLAQPAGPP